MDSYLILYPHQSVATLKVSAIHSMDIFEIPSKSNPLSETGFEIRSFAIWTLL